MQEGSRWLIKAALDVVREEAIRREWQNDSTQQVRSTWVTPPPSTKENLQKDGPNVHIPGGTSEIDNEISRLLAEPRGEASNRRNSTRLQPLLAN
jgi:hypothetical protein